MSASISATWAPIRPWWTRILTRQVQLCLDLAVLSGAFASAYLLRFDFAIGPAEFRNGLFQLPCVVAVQISLLIITGVYAFIWRYVGISEIKAFFSAASWSALPLIVARIAVSEAYQIWRVPFSIIIIDTIFGFGAVLGLRVLRRLVYERYERNAQGKSLNGTARKSVLLIGAGRAGVLAANQILGRGGLDLAVRGFVDDDVNKQGAVIGGVKVLGTTHDLARLVRELKIDHVIISIAQASRNNFRRILDICEEIPVKARIVPSLHEVLQGKLKVSRIRDVQIEDLLGREPVQLEEDNLRSFLGNRNIIVTGAGGSIGSELARQVARFRPSRLLLVERAEFSLFNIERELRAAWPDLVVVPLVADVSDDSRMRSILTCYNPHVILHAAAHKHVPMMEFNPSEAIKNNTLATYALGKLAGEFGVGAFVLISTDKAVRPTSVMGAAKRVAELVIQDLDRHYATRYVAVRFGNVIGSAGSVVPIFREQIREGGPVTVTHPEMKRYFMTIAEAAQLVLQASVMGEGGEIFILDMGEPLNVLDLAKATIILSGLKPFEDIDIVFTGLRAGEKLFEELDTKDERIAKTRHPKIFIGKIAPYPTEQVSRALFRLAILARRGDELELRKFLNDLLPEAQLDVAEAIIPRQEEAILQELSA